MEEAERFSKDARLKKTIQTVRKPPSTWTRTRFRRGRAWHIRKIIKDE
jgi:hypothetical protein